MWAYNQTDELYHYGIIGMRWGKRMAGGHSGPGAYITKKRQAAIEARTAKKDKTSADSKTASSLKKKRLNELSNDELRKLNDRMQLEQNYARLNPSVIKKGLTVVKASADIMNTALNVYNNSDKIISVGKTIADKLIKK